MKTINFMNCANLEYIDLSYFTDLITLEDNSFNGCVKLNLINDY